MRILFLTPEVPYPAQSGGTIKTASILEYLSRRHEVHLACFRRGPFSREQSRWLASVPRRAITVHGQRGRTPLNLTRSYLHGVPLSIERNRSPRMAAIVGRWLKDGSYDAVFVDSWLMAQYLPADYHGKTLLHQHNAEHVMWRRQAEREKSPLLKALVTLEYRRVRSYEAGALLRFDTIFAVSEADRQAIVALGAGAERVRLLPNLPEPELLTKPGLSFAASEPVVLYLGTLSWQPNIEGLEYFLRYVFPRLRKLAPEARLVIAGRGAPARLERLALRTDGVEFLGPIADAEAQYARARVFVEASHTGGGTRLKVLSALARGLPVVVGAKGAEGLDVVAGEHLLVADDPHSMAEAVARLMSDEGLWRSLSERGRALIRSRYVADVAYKVLDEALSGAGVNV